MATGRQRILVVVGDRTFGGAMERQLVTEGYEVAVSDRAGMLQAASRMEPSVIVVERGMPAQDLRRLAGLRRAPVVVVQPPDSRCAEDECVDDLDAGADALICNQSYREAVARIRAVLRREGFHAAPSSAFVVGKLRIDVEAHDVSVQGRTVALTPKEFKLLHELAREPGRVFTRDELLTRVWGNEIALQEHALEVHIHSLRRKIETNPARPRYLLTVRSRGYKLNDGV